jgi:beta-glucanase (GH16 family)
MHYGTASVIMQTAPGIGVISSAVLLSDDLDEIDWEISGNNYGANTPNVQTNYYGKGITGYYDRSTQPTISANSSSNFLNYTFVWTPTAITWMVNGTVVRTLNAASCDNGTHQYPQTPVCRAFYFLVLPVVRPELTQLL